MKTKERFNKKLLVEGGDDQHVVWALCENYKISENFDVIDCEGIDSLKEHIYIFSKQRSIQTIGIVIDADTALQARWTSIKNILTETGFTIPQDLLKEGLIVNNETQKVGIWIMPDNNTNGMLEDFISFLVPKDDKLIPVVDSTLCNIEKQKLNKYSDVHKSKAKIHTWLAWQENPGTPMGLSITKRYLSTDDEVCQRFVNWLKSLFS